MPLVNHAIIIDIIDMFTQYVRPHVSMEDRLVSPKFNLLDANDLQTLRSLVQGRKDRSHMFVCGFVNSNPILGEDSHRF